MFLPQSERPSFAPIQYIWQNYSFVYFNLSFFIWDGKTKDFGLNDSKHSLNLIYSTSPYVFMEWYLVKHRDNFTLFSYLLRGVCSTITTWRCAHGCATVVT
jgi:hypothetical protein